MNRMAGPPRLRSDQYMATNFILRADRHLVSTGGRDNIIPQWLIVTIMAVLTCIRGQLHAQFRSVTRLANLTSSGGDYMCR